MNIKEQLKQYRALKLELEDINGQTRDASIHDSVKGSKKNFPWTLGTKHVEGVPEEYYNLLARKSDIESQLREIKIFVDTIKDYKVRKAIRIYYIDPLSESCEKPTWENVADEFNDGSTGDSIKQSVSRYLKKIS